MGEKQSEKHQIFAIYTNHWYNDVVNCYKGTSKNPKHKFFSTMNGLFSRQKPRFSTTKATFLEKTTLVPSENSLHV